MEERPSFESFYATHYAGLRAWASRRFGPDDADDIAQETMLSLYERYDDFGRPVDAQWLMVVARTIGVPRMRESRRQAILELDPA